MTPLYIFDLDGTLALIEHRRHFVECERDKQNWLDFYLACVDDKPNKAVIQTLEILEAHAEIWIFSGRSEVVRSETLAWLDRHIGHGPWNLTMRPQGNFIRDEVLKRQWYDGMLPEDQARLVGVFDDRDRVVQMWRSLGVTCFQVAEGKF